MMDLSTLTNMGIHALFSLLVHMTVGFPFFLLELVSELAKVVPIQGIHGIWTALCLHYDNACRIIVLLGRDTSSFIGLVYQHPMAIMLVILYFVASYLGSFALASNRALVARVNPPPVHELPAFVVANAPSFILALFEWKETEEIYENRIVSSFSFVFGFMPLWIYSLFLFLTVPIICQLPVNMRRGAAIVCIPLLLSMILPHLLTLSWIERKSSDASMFPFLLSLTDALMPGPLMESNHDFFYQYRQMYPIVMLLLFTIYSALQSIFDASCRCPLSLYMSINSVLCCTLNYMFEVLVAGFSHYGFTNVVFYVSTLVAAKFFIFEGIDLFRKIAIGVRSFIRSLKILNRWCHQQFTESCIALFFLVGSYLFALFVASCCALFVHLNPPEPPFIFSGIYHIVVIISTLLRDVRPQEVDNKIKILKTVAPALSFHIVFSTTFLLLVRKPSELFLRQYFPWRELRLNRTNGTNIICIAVTCLPPLLTLRSIGASFVLSYVDALMPGPLRETAPTFAAFLRNNGYSSQIIGFFFGQ